MVINLEPEAEEKLIRWIGWLHVTGKLHKFDPAYMLAAIVVKGCHENRESINVTLDMIHEEGVSDGKEG